MTAEPKCPARRRLRREDDLFGPGWHWTHADDYGSLCHQDERCGAKPPPCPGCDRVLDREGENGKWSKRILTLDGVTAVTCRHRLNGQWVDCPGPEKAEPGLVERLRQWPATEQDAEEAADHIEALEAQLAEAKGLIEWAHPYIYGLTSSVNTDEEQAELIDWCQKAHTAGFVEENRDAE